MESSPCTIKRTIVARFDAGEDLLLSLEALAREHDIRGGWFTLIGGLKEIAYGLYEPGSGHRVVKKAAQRCFELLQTAGTISLKEGNVFIHAHVSAADEEGRAFGGHLAPGSKVFPFAEVCLHETDIPLGRRLDPATSLWSLTFER